MYSQYGFAWHGTHFDGLLARAIAPRTLVSAHVTTFAALGLTPLLIIPVVTTLRPEFLPSICAFILYNLGIATPVLVAIGVWTRKTVKLDQSTFFNHQGTSTHHFVIMLPIMGLPIGLAAWNGLSWALWLTGDSASSASLRFRPAPDGSAAFFAGRGTAWPQASVRPSKYVWTRRFV